MEKVLVSVPDPDLEIAGRGGGGEGSVWSKNKGGRAPPRDTPRSLGTATALIMGDKGRVFSISFHPR